MPRPYQVTHRRRANRPTHFEGRFTARVMIRVTVVSPRRDAEIPGLDHFRERIVQLRPSLRNFSVGQMQPSNSWFVPTQSAKRHTRLSRTHADEVDTFGHLRMGMRCFTVGDGDNVDRNVARERGLNQTARPQYFIVGVGRDDYDSSGRQF